MALALALHWYFTGISLALGVPTNERIIDFAIYLLPTSPSQQLCASPSHASHGAPGDNPLLSASWFLVSSYVKVGQRHHGKVVLVHGRRPSVPLFITKLPTTYYLRPHYHIPCASSHVGLLYSRDRASRNRFKERMQAHVISSRMERTLSWGYGRKKPRRVRYGRRSYSVEGGQHLPRGTKGAKLCPKVLSMRRVALTCGISRLINSSPVRLKHQHPSPDSFPLSRSRADLPL